MRRVSFSMTAEQMRHGARAARLSADGYASVGKDITRRLAWHWATPGMYLIAVSKTMGLRPGERAEVFGVIEVLHVSRGPLAPVPVEDVAREGFPGMSALAFEAKFMQHAKGDPYLLEVTRVVFRHVDWRRFGPWIPHLSTDQLIALAESEAA